MLTFFSVLVLEFCAGAPVSDSPALLEEFREQAPLGWSRLETWDANGHRRCTLTETQNGRTLRDTELRIDRREGLTVCTEFRVATASPNRSNQVVRGFNTQYGFWLRDSGKTPLSWVLQSVASGETGASAIRLEISRKYFVALTPGYGLDPDMLLRDTMSQPTFRWIAAERVSIADRDCIRVTFSRTRKFEQIEEPVPFEGFMVFDPANSWACVEMFSKTTKPTRGIAQRALSSWTYSDMDLEGIRTPVESVYRVRWDDTGSMDDVSSSYQLRCKWTEIDAKKPSVEKFYLSGYGLPEPIGMQPPSAPRTWLWLLLSAITLAGVAIYGARRTRARKHA